MKKVIVLGSGCKKCVKTAELINAVAERLHIDVEVSKETDAETIMGFGVMSTPAVVIDNQVMHSGSIPQTSAVEQWLKA